MAAGDDSLIKDELTLPIDWENSGRMSFLGQANSDETLLEERKSMKKTPTQPFSSMPDLSALPPTHSRNSEAPNSGASGDRQVRLTPIGGRPLSLKEYEQQLNDLKKENFNLKLRIYFLENRLPKIEGCSGEDVLKKNVNLQVEIETMKNELEHKEKLLNEAMQNFKRIQISHVRELEECRQEAEEAREKDKQELIRCSSLLGTVRAQFDEFGKSYGELEAENRRLKELVNFSESDTEISLLSEKEREIMHLKSQLVQLQRQISDQKQKYEEDLRKVETDVQTVAATTDVNKSNNFTVWVMQQRQDFDFNRASGYEYAGYETGMIVPSSGCDEKLIDLQRQLDDKTFNLKSLQDQIQLDRSELHKKSEENEILRVDLEKERENGVKRDKTIQGLLKMIENERKSTQNDEISLAGVSSLTDPSLFQTSLTEENLDVENLKQRLKDMEIGRKSLYERIRRVAEFLLKLAEKFSGEARDALLSLSTDLSKIQDDFADASMNLLPNEEMEIEKLREEIVEKDAKINEKQKIIDELANNVKILRQETSMIQEKLSLELDDKTSTISGLISSADEKDRRIASLLTSMKEKEKIVADVASKEIRFKELINARDKIANELDDKKREISTLLSSLDEKNRKIESILTFINEKDGIIRDLTVSNDNLRAELAKTSEKRLNSELDALKREITPLIATLNEKDLKISALLASTTEKDAIIKELKDNYLRRNSSNEKLNLELEEKKREILLLLSSLEEKDDVIKNLMSSNDDNHKELSNAYDALLTRLESKTGEISQLISSLNEKEKEMENLALRNEKLERYGKTLKGKYRKLESTCKCGAGDGKNNENNQQLQRKQTSLDDEIESLLNDEQEHNVRLESVVKQLEENNRILAERMLEHEITDGALKQEAAKVKSLKAKVATYEKKLRGENN